MTGKTAITLDVDLDRVHSLGPGDTFGFAAAASETCEVYVVTRSGDRVMVDAFSLDADVLNIVALNHS